MPGIHIKQFAGLMPEAAARNLPQTCAQIAHNCLLRDGALRPMPRWKKFKQLTNATARTHIYENSLTGDIVSAYEFGEGALLIGEPFANNTVVGISINPITVPGYKSNIYQTQGIGGNPDFDSYPAGVPTPLFAGADMNVLSSSVNFIAELQSMKPVNRIMGITFCRNIGGMLQEGPIAVIPGQAPFGIMFEGDTLQVSLTFDMNVMNLNKITHVRLYRTISGLDSGEKVGNELDTDWHLVDTLEIRDTLNYADGGAVTTDPMDLYLAGHFYQHSYKVSHFGLTEGGWFYAVADDGKLSVSERYLHHAWPVENKVDIREEVTDAVTHFDNIYVGTRAQPFVISLAPGEAPQGLQIGPTRFPARLPCLSGTMVAASSGALYTSPHGVVSLSRSGQQVISAGLSNTDDVLYKAKIEEVLEPPVPAYREEVRFSRAILGAYHEGMYFGLTESYQTESEARMSRYAFAYHTGDQITGDNKYGQLVTLDVPFGAVDQATVTRKGLTLKYANDLFCLPLPGNGEDKEYRKSAKACYQWKSKKFVFPGSMTLAAGLISHECGGTVTMRLYVDCKCVWQTEICDCEPFRIPSQIIGKEFEVEVMGTRAVYEIHLASSMQELLEE